MEQNFITKEEKIKKKKYEAPEVSTFEREVKKRIIDLIKDNKKYKSIRDFCIQTGMPYHNIDKMLNNKQRMNLSYFGKIMAELDNDFLSVFMDKETVNSKVDNNDSDFVKVPMVPIWTFEKDKDASEVYSDTSYQYFQKGFIFHFSNPILTIIQDSSMEPRIEKDSEILISRGIHDRTTPTQENIYLVKDHESKKMMVRRVKDITSSLRYEKKPDVLLSLQPENKDYKSKEIVLEKGNLLDVIIGRVVWTSKRV